MVRVDASRYLATIRRCFHFFSRWPFPKTIENAQKALGLFAEMRKGCLAHLVRSRRRSFLD